MRGVRLGFGEIRGAVFTEVCLHRLATSQLSADKTIRLDESQQEVGGGGGVFLGHVTPNDRFQTTSDVAWILKKSSVACKRSILEFQRGNFINQY